MLLHPLRARTAARLSTAPASSLSLHHRTSTILPRSPRLSPQQHLLRPFASTTLARSSDSSHGHHEEPYDPPTGWLWGVPPGQKYENEGWEGIWIYGFFGSMLFLVVGYCYKPDSRYTTLPVPPFNSVCCLSELIFFFPQKNGRGMRSTRGID